MQRILFSILMMCAVGFVASTLVTSADFGHQFAPYLTEARLLSEEVSTSPEQLERLLSELERYYGQEVDATEPPPSTAQIELEDRLLTRLDRETAHQPLIGLTRNDTAELLDILGELRRLRPRDDVLPRGSSQSDIIGTVTDASTGFPLANEFSVQLYDSSGNFLDSDRTDGSGVYAFAGLPTGTYFVRTDIDGYFDELYDDLPCPLDCVVTSGTPVSVSFGSVSSGIDFELSTGGALTGTVTDAGTGFPLANEFSVQLYDSSGNFLDSDRTDGSGVYAFAGLPTGTYFVRTDIDGYFDELYDDLPCPLDCVVTSGTPVSVSFGSVSSGIDFELSTGGAITGAVTDAGTGFPLANEFSVQLYDSSGNFLDSERTDGNGVYSFVGVPSGTYFVRTDIDGYFDELYDDLPCPLACDVTSGTPVSVSFGSVSSGIDFELSTGGAITGTVTDAGTGFPLTNEFSVQLFDSGGSFLDSERTDGNGVYSFAGLPTGTYFVRTAIDGHFDELYDDLPCPLACDVTTGTPISVSFGSVSSGIDFELGEAQSDEIFTDGFEAGDTSAWSKVVP